MSFGQAWEFRPYIKNLSLNVHARDLQGVRAHEALSHAWINPRAHAHGCGSPLNECVHGYDSSPHACAHEYELPPDEYAHVHASLLYTRSSSPLIPIRKNLAICNFL